MPKPSSVTQEAVNKVALDLFLRGVNPSINVVQAELRRHVGAPGSTTVVTRLLEAWKKSIAETLSAHLESSPPNAVEVLAKELAVAAAERASVEYEAWKAEVQSSAQDAIRQSQERAATLVVDNQRLVMELGSATQEVKQLSEALARTETENAALASSLDQKAIAEAALNQEVSALKQAIDACTEAARAAKHEHEQNLAVLRAEHAGQVSSLEAQSMRALMEASTAFATQLKDTQNQHSEKLSSLSKAHEMERNRMLLEVDGIRTQYAQLQKASAGQLSEITSLKEKFNKAELEKQLALQRANLLENDNRKLLLQIESSERRLTELNDSLRTLANSGGDGKLDQ